MERWCLAVVWLLWTLTVVVGLTAGALLLVGCGGCAVGADGAGDLPGLHAQKIPPTDAVLEATGWVAYGNGWREHGGWCSYVEVADGGDGSCLTAEHCIRDLGFGPDAVARVACRELRKPGEGLVVGPAPQLGAVVWTYGHGCRRYRSEAAPLLRPGVVVEVGPATNGGPPAFKLDSWPGPVCGGDSGGAALDAEGRLVGIISRWVELPGGRGLGTEVLFPTTVLVP